MEKKDYVKPEVLIEGVSNVNLFEKKQFAKIPITEDLFEFIKDYRGQYQLYIRTVSRELNPEVIRWSLIGFPIEAK